MNLLADCDIKLVEVSSRKKGSRLVSFLARTRSRAQLFGDHTTAIPSGEVFKKHIGRDGAVLPQALRQKGL
jgi:hypothetical protein